MRTLIHTSAASLLALLALAMGAAAQQSSRNLNPLFAHATARTQAAAQQQQQEVPGDGVRRITPAQVRAALEKGEAVIIDVRGEGAYEAGHIKGALHMPTDELLSRVGELPRDKMIIAYCS
jgi:predicted sulfurtransferase